MLQAAEEHAEVTGARAAAGAGRGEAGEGLHFGEWPR